MSENIFEDVREFQTAFGQQPGAELALTQVALICEEIAEFFAAVGLRDLATSCGDASSILKTKGPQLTGTSSAIFNAVSTSVKLLAFPPGPAGITTACPDDVGAYIEERKVEALDGAIDAIFVLAGFVNAARMNGAGAWDEVMRSNMGKVFPDGTVQRDAAGKVVKPPGFAPPELRYFIYAPEVPDAAGAP